MTTTHIGIMEKKMESTMEHGVQGLEWKTQWKVLSDDVLRATIGSTPPVPTSHH